MEERYQSEIEAFGQRVKTIRNHKGLSQFDIEVSTGIPQAEISRIENGLKNIEFFTLIKLAEALQVQLNEFFPSK